MHLIYMMSCLCLSYHIIFSVTKSYSEGQTVQFTKSACYVPGKYHKMIAKASKVGSIYQPSHETVRKQTRRKICGTNGLGI